MSMYPFIVSQYKGLIIFLVGLQKLCTHKQTMVSFRIKRRRGVFFTFVCIAKCFKSHEH